jgi:hypothetical protein
LTIGLRYGTVDSVCIAAFDLPFVVQKQKIVSLTDRVLGNCSRDLLQDELFDLRILSLVTIESEKLGKRRRLGSGEFRSGWLGGGGSEVSASAAGWATSVSAGAVMGTDTGGLVRGCSSSSATIVFFFMIVPAKLGFIQTV